MQYPMIIVNFYKFHGVSAEFTSGELPNQSYAISSVVSRMKNCALLQFVLR